MRNLLLASVALGLAVTPAMAQDSSSGRATAPMGAPSASAPARTPSPNPLASEDLSKLKGTDVYGSNDKKIGDISTVLMKPDTKTVDRVVVKSGGVLGVGGRHVALGIDELSWDADRGAFKVSKTEDDIKSMTEWKDPASATASGSSGSTGSLGGSGAPATAPVTTTTPAR
jgi:sporulation protein YlmC with PRC-barrel domain